MIILTKNVLARKAGTFTFLKIAILLSLITIGSLNVSCQEIKLITGVNLRMEEMNFLNFETVQNYTYGLVPYSAAINMRGWSLNLGLGYYDKNGWGVEYVPNLHYDYLHHYFDFLPYHQSWAERRKNITFFVDHNFRLVKSWGEERTKYIAVGVSIFNVGKGFFYNNSNPPAPIDTYFNLEFISYNLAFGYAILPDLYIEPSANLAVKSFPTNKVDNILIWNLSLKYQVPLIGASR